MHLLGDFNACVATRSVGKVVGAAVGVAVLDFEALDLHGVRTRRMISRCTK